MTNHPPGCAALRPQHSQCTLPNNCNCELGRLRARVVELEGAMKALITAFECSSPDYGEDMDRARKALEKDE